VRYPRHWWQAATDLAEWEISPSAAGEGEVILSKRHELGLLSNFAPTPFEFEGARYESVEGFWQMLKYPENAQDPRAKLPWPRARAEVARLTAFPAREAGDLADMLNASIDITWVTYQNKKLDPMESTKGDFYRLIRAVEEAKLAQNESVREVLKSTGDLRLLPDHRMPRDAPPAWRYYEIWMELRAGLQSRSM
jgi:hypothetical protein